MCGGAVQLDSKLKYISTIYLRCKLVTGCNPLVAELLSHAINQLKTRWRLAEAQRAGGTGS